MIALARSGNPKAHDSVEHGADQVGDGLHLDRAELTGLDACRNAAGQKRAHPPAIGFDVAGKDIGRIVEPHRARTGNKINFIGKFCHDGNGKGVKSPFDG